MSEKTPDYVLANRTAWDRSSAGYAAAGERHWAGAPVWGVFGIPEIEAHLLPPDVAGSTSLEVGCGTGYVSAWLKRLGAHPIGIDNSAHQLETAHRLQDAHGLRFPLLHGIAEALPFRDATFDLVISEYGAAIWSDPYLWIPEAARVLRPGGELIFLGSSTLLMLAVPDEEGAAADQTLRRDQFGMHRLTWPDDPSVEFHLSHGDWIRLLRSNGFDVEDLVELRPGPDATTTYDFVTVAWARRWPAEEAWKARKRA